jgi:hypothetical protein
MIVLLCDAILQPNRTSANLKQKRTFIGQTKATNIYQTDKKQRTFIRKRKATNIYQKEKNSEHLSDKQKQ